MADVTEKQFSELIAEQKASKEIAGDAMQKQMDGIGKLVSAQNETTRTLARSLMSAEERAAADAEASRKNANRVAGGIQAAETRKANADAESLASNESQGEESSSLLSKIGKSFTSFFSFSKGSASSDKEKENEKASDLKKGQDLLGKIAGGITGLGKSFIEGAKDKAKKGLTGFMSMLKKFAIGGLMTALLLFMNSKYWQDTKKFISDKLMPKLEHFYNAFFGPDGGFASGFDALFGDVGGLGGILLGLTGVVTIITALKIFKTLKNLRLAYIALKAATIKNILTPLQNSVKAAAGKVWTFMKLIPPALIALKLFFLSTFLPAVTAFMVPLLPIIAIAAAIGVALFALKSAFDDFMCTLDETGSIGEALKVGAAKFMATLIAWPAALVLKLVGWVAGLFGFDDFKSKVDAIDPIQFISDTISDMISGIVDWFNLLFTDPIAAITSAVGGYISLFTDFGGFVYKKAIKPAIDWIGGLFGVEDASGQMEGYIGKKLDNIINFAGAIYDKYIKPIVDWFSNLFSTAVKDVKESPAGKSIGKAMDMAKNFTKTALLSVLPKPGGSKLSVGYWASKAIPDSLYKYAGLDPKTGEVVKQTAEAITEQNKPMMSEAESDIGSGGITVEQKELNKKETARLQRAQNRKNKRDEVAERLYDKTFDETKIKRSSGRLISTPRSDKINRIAMREMTAEKRARFLARGETEDNVIMRKAKLDMEMGRNRGSSANNNVDASQKVVNANKTSFTSVGQPLENTNMAGFAAVY